MLTDFPETFEGNCYAICKREMVVKADGNPLSFADLQAMKKNAINYIVEPENKICAIELLSVEDLPKQYSIKTIRQSFFDLEGNGDFELARACALLTWNKDTKYCSQCGGKLYRKQPETAKLCPTCGKIYFTRIEPCIIVLVHKGDKMLLGRHVQRNQEFFSCLAGFIEGGESAEHAVAREIMEETGIKVKNIQYRGSQSWPFPDQLMLAFTAEYESGNIKLQEDELSAADWFDRDNCPTTPAPGSIAYKLIHNLI